jgi:hypothetical protein
MVEVQVIKGDFEISESRKHLLMGISRSYKYSKEVLNPVKEGIKHRILEISEDEFMCVYGEKKVHCRLLLDCYKVSLNIV